MPAGIFDREPIVDVNMAYGRLTPIRLDHKDFKSQQFWLFRCDCGNEKVINVAHVKNGSIKSCGCYHAEAAKKQQLENCATHGMSRSREYTTWQKMKERCYSPDSISYKYYGARGISVCDEWRHSFETFYRDMGERPQLMSLDRIDSNGNYCKKNCKWSTAKEQSNNRRKRRTNLELKN